MEERETQEYKVEFTPTSRRYFFEILEYFYEVYTIDRAEQLADELEEFTQSLNLQPNRGTPERWLSDSSKEYRFILFQRTKRADVKIIYYVDDESNKVFVTDFFPTESDSEKITDRSS